MTARPDDLARRGEGHHDLLVDRTTEPHPHEVGFSITGEKNTLIGCKAVDTADDVVLIVIGAAVVVFALLCAAGIGLWLAGWW